MLKIIKKEKENFGKDFPDINILNADKLYILYLDKKEIGYASINESDKYHKIVICILKEQQGNGYGTYLFREMLKEINQEFELAVDIDNYKMIRIITRCGGKELGRNGKEVFFLIPKYHDSNNKKDNV